MKKVDLVFGGWIKAPNGAAYVVNSLAESKKEFYKNGIDLSTWSLDNILPRSFEEYKKNKNPWYIRAVLSIKKTLDKFVSKNAKKNMLFTSILLSKNFKIAKMVGKSYAKKNKNNIVLMHDFFTCFYYLKYRKTKVPTVLVLHNNGDTFSMLLEYYPVLKNSRKLVSLKRMEKYVLNEVTKVCFVAKNPMDKFILLHPDFPSKNVSFIYNGLKDITTPLRNSNKNAVLRLCCVGSITTRKGQDLLINALKELDEDILRKIHVTFVGDGPIREELESISNKYYLPVTFVGYSKNVDKYLNECDIFVLPSRDEGFPISILEAMRKGIPVISTKVAGIPEMIENGISGLLIEPSVHDLKNVFSSIFNYDWAEMGNRSRKLFLEKFSIHSMISNYSSILLSIKSSKNEV